MDTAGQERYRTITTAYYRGAMGFILMYDITNEESFNAVQDWATQIKTYSWDNAQVILVGNKCDMEEERVVPTEKGRLLAEQLGFDFFEASAKENISVRQAFERLVDAICDKMSDSLDSDPSMLGTSKTTHLITPHCGPTPTLHSPVILCPPPSPEPAELLLFFACSGGGSMPLRFSACGLTYRHSALD
uniref:small monomeric GTPase n=1 Tax=Rousettus aegyptiacus TaxID=9407 RepID=A0A7J8KFA8_ROUAE|nr:RAB3B, member RAS oncogene family [Rousettus aegyptiacus]